MTKTVEDFIDLYSDEVFGTSSLEALVGAALTRALKPHRASLMTAGLTIVTVPDSTWFEEALRQARQIWHDRPVEIAPDPAKTSRDTTSSAWLRKIKSLLSSGRGPIILVDDPERRLPNFLRVSADVVVNVPSPDLKTVIEAGRLVLRGQVRRYFRDIDVTGLDLETLSSCLARGSSAKIAAQRLRAAGSASTATAAIDDSTLPSLENVAGYGPALDWSRELLTDLTEYRAGRLPWDEVGSAAVVHGPPGTGKSLLARITANAAGIPLITASIAELFTATDGHLDNVLKRLRAIFDEAMKKAPSLLFFDELDALPSRGAGGVNENYWRPVVNEFLMLLDSCTSRLKGVVVLGATNRLADLDPALLRSQRLDRLIYVGPPDPPELARILRSYLQKDQPNADLLSLVSARPGATGADARSWARNARRRARRAGRPMSYEDLTSEIVGTEHRGPETLRRVAIHEAGHAIAAHALGISLDLVTLVPGSDDYGCVLLSPRLEGVSTKSSLERDVIVMLGGRAAEHVVFGSDHSTAAGGADASDLAQATMTVIRWHVEWGLSNGLVYRSASSGILERDPELREVVKEELNRLYGFAQGVMVTHHAALIQLAEELMRRRTLGTTDLTRFLDAIWDGVTLSSQD